MMDVRVGDIALFRKPANRDDGPMADIVEYLQKEFDGVAIHAALIMRAYNGFYTTVQVDSQGVQLNYPIDITNPDVCIRRIKGRSIDPVGLRNTIQIWYSKMPKDAKTGRPDYDYKGVFIAGLWKFMQDLSGGRLWRRPILPDNAIPFCSESVAELLYGNIAFRFMENISGMVIPDNVLTPTDILKSNQLEDIKEFG